MVTATKTKPATKKPSTAKPATKAGKTAPIMATTLIRIGGKTYAEGNISQGDVRKLMAKWCGVGEPPTAPIRKFVWVTDAS